MREENITSCKILIGCFLIEFLIAGTARLSSIYFVESLTRYDVDRKQASFPFVLAYMTKNLSGPVVEYLEKILGMKWVITTGCLMATLSIGGCFFAEDILVITLLWGLILGLSYVFTHQMQPPLLNHHFKENKSKANGFTTAGGSIGAALLPVIATACINTYGTSGSFLVLSAILAHSIPASLLLKNPIRRSNDNVLNGDMEAIKYDSSLGNEVMDEISHTTKDLNQEQIYTACYSKSLSQAWAGSKEPTNTFRENQSCPYDVFFSETQFTNNGRKEQNKSIKPPILDKSKFTLRNFRIFLDPTYIVILLIHGVSAVITTTVWTIILDFVRDKQVPKQLEIYYVILLPLTDLFGCISSGFIIDKKFITISNFALIIFIIKAMMFVVIVYSQQFILLMACEAIISVGLGSTVVLKIALTQEFMEEDKRTMAQSCRQMLYAPLSFVQAPMIGYFRGSHGSYDNIFHIMSVASLFCGCAAYILPHLAKSRRM